MFTKLFQNFIPETMQASYIVNQVDVMHAIEGRLRVVYKKLKTDDSLYSSVCEQLDGIEAITDWKINRTTGSVTINYDPELIEPDSFLEKLVEGAKAKYQKRV